MMLVYLSLGLAVSSIPISYMSGYIYTRIQRRDDIKLIKRANKEYRIGCGDEVSKLSHKVHSRMDKLKRSPVPPVRIVIE